jgi:flavin-dependent dehydrogenase
VDVYLGRAFELYVTPLPGHELLVAALASPDALDAPVEEQFRRWRLNEPGISARLGDAEQITELRVTSPLSGRARRRVVPGCVLLGDAAGFADPITGGGITQALMAAELLARFARQGLSRVDSWLPEFDRAREALLRDYRQLTGLMLWLSQHPAAALCTFGTMRRTPRLFSHLLGVSSCVRRLWGGAIEFGDRPAWPVQGQRADVRQ